MPLRFALLCGLLAAAQARRPSSFDEVSREHFVLDVAATQHRLPRHPRLLDAEAVASPPRSEHAGRSAAPPLALVQQGSTSVRQEPATRGASQAISPWSERLLAGWPLLLVAVLVIPLALAVLWVSERRVAQVETLLGHGEKEARTVEAEKAPLQDFDDTLVHLDSEIARGVDMVQDARFGGIRLERGCLKLRSIVEVYQWVEHVDDWERDEGLRGCKIVRSCKYQKEWCRSAISSARFKHGEGHQNVLHVNGLAVGAHEQVNGTVKYGDAYILPKELVAQLSNYQDAEDLVGDTLDFEASPQEAYTFIRQVGGWYHHPVRSLDPHIGDFRVRMEVVPDGPVSILAVQLEGNEGYRTFGAYRSISRGLFWKGEDQQELKARRRRAAEQAMPAQERSSSCFCGLCSVVLLLLSRVWLTEVFRAWPGHVSKAECLAAVRASAAVRPWGLRLLGGALLWSSLAAARGPLSVLVEFAPALGPYMRSEIPRLFGLLCFLLTVASLVFIKAVAYMAHQPFVTAQCLVWVLCIMVAAARMGGHFQMA